MRRKSLVLLSILVLLFVSRRDADAFIKYLGELSGPGYWLGTDFIFPWSISSCNIQEGDLLEVPTRNTEEAELENQRVSTNVEALKSLGLFVTRLHTNPDDFLASPDQCRLFVEKGGIFLPAGVCSSDRELGSEVEENEFFVTRIEGFVRAYAALVFNEKEKSDESGSSRQQKNESALDNSQTSPDPTMLKDLIAELNDPASVRDTELIGKMRGVLKDAVPEINKRVRKKTSEDCRDVTRRYGASPAGLFGSSQALPQVTGSDEERRFNNWFISLALGISVATRNQLNYGDDFAGDTDAIWLSAYPALEKRFWMSGNRKRNGFVNFGPSFNYFIGSQFDDFLKVSVRARAGVRLYPVQFGLEVHFWGSSFRPSDFGAVSSDRDGDNVTLGFFFSIELGTPPPSEHKKTS